MRSFLYDQLTYDWVASENLQKSEAKTAKTTTKVTKDPPMTNALSDLMRLSMEAFAD